MSIRNIQLCKQLISKLKLDLTGLTVATECASGAYAYTPILALLSGAQVISIGRDSSYGSFQDNKTNIEQIITKNNIEGKISFLEKNKLNSSEVFNTVNIITNSGMIRPLNIEIIDLLPTNTVIPLMWETWEFRPTDLDIVACQTKKIPVIGTNESYEGINMFGYNSFIVLKLLFDLGIEGHNNKLLLLGGGKSGTNAYIGLKKMGLDVEWYTLDGEINSKKYTFLKENILTSNFDAVINFEHEHDIQLIGKSGYITFDELIEHNPSIVYGHICGNIDINQLKKSQLKYLPKKILPFGYMSYETTNLGDRPVLELCALGLKVGEIAAKARLKGASIQDAIQATINCGIGQDFKGGFMNYGRN